jgi:hypothetical protein
MADVASLRRSVEIRMFDQYGTIVDVQSSWFPP